MGIRVKWYLAMQAVLMLCVSTIVHAQAYVPGQLSERVVSRSNPTQSYALFVPSAYDSTRTWPVIFLMDPRGRALVPMAGFRPAAEKYGYIVVSSYNTLSDGAVKPNMLAINAMIADVRASLRADPRRYYLAGFSGTARLAWDLESELYGTVAGIFGAGASGATPTPYSMPIRPAASFFGTVGVYDMNYEEMRAYEVYMRDTGVPHRVRYFAKGGHQWPPDSLAMQAIEYFHLRAMRRGLIPSDSQFITQMFSADTTRARAAEQTRNYEEALNRWREIEREYASPDRARIAKSEVQRLSADPRVEKDIEHRGIYTRSFAEGKILLALWLLKTDSAKQPFDVKKAAKELRIDELHKAASNKRDADAAESAERSIADMWAQLGSYYPRAALADGRKALALAYLDLADILRPESTRNSSMRAEANR